MSRTDDIKPTGRQSVADGQGKLSTDHHRGDPGRVVLGADPDTIWLPDPNDENAEFLASRTDLAEFRDSQIIVIDLTAENADENERSE